MPKTFTKRIARPGWYNVPYKDKTTGEVKTRRTYIGKDRINKWLENHRRMTALGLRVPAPFRHEEKAVPVRADGDEVDDDSYNNGGFWDKLWTTRDGALWGRLETERDDAAERIGTTVKDVSLLAKIGWKDGAGNTFDDALTHIALVQHPVINDTEEGGFRSDDKPAADITQPLDERALLNVNETTGIALSLQDLHLAGDFNSMGGAGSGGSGSSGNPGAGGTGMNAASATCKDIIGLLRQLKPPVNLPDDTGAENFLERFATALNAVLPLQESDEESTSLREPKSGSKEQPGPVAMSKELQLSLDLLNAHGAVNPATGKPWSEADLKRKAAAGESIVVETKLSLEDQAAVNFATNTMRVAYQTRVENLVKSGRITPKLAKASVAPLLTELKLSFGADGKPVRGPLDMLLEGYEAIPQNSVLTGRSPANAKAQRGEIFSEEAFSIDAGLQVEEAPLEDDGDILSMDEADAILDQQFSASGKRSNQVEGGIRRRQPAGV